MTGSPAVPLRIRTIADREASAPKAWAVEGIFAAGEVSTVVAPPGMAKSALATDAACSIAAGQRWFGRKVSPRAAVYVAAERGAVTLRRLKAFATYHEVNPLDVAVISERIDLLRNGQDAERILEAVRSYEERTGRPVRLIVIDTARAVMPGGDENSGKDMGNLARHLGIIRDGAPGAHVQILHHTPKGRPTEATGHTALIGMVDLVMVVSAKGDRRSWAIVEANDLPNLPPRAFFDLHSVTIG
jgi:RecA-family ATPase